MYNWVNNLGPRKNSVIDRLTKQSVSQHKNIRLEDEIGPSKALSDPLSLNALTGGIAGTLLPGLAHSVSPGVGATQEAHAHGTHGHGHGASNPLISGLLGGLGLGSLSGLTGIRKPGRR